jgi:FKBP-type peptidyl-prolyl cis-trans isomerase SlpA
MTGPNPMPNTPPVIAPGCVVTLHLALILPDGTVVLSTFDTEPMRFVVGDGTLAIGLEALLYGLRAGDESIRSVSGERAFGPHDPARIHRLPRTDFPADLPLVSGSLVGFRLPNADDLAGTVLELDDREVLVDFNHPLAGGQLLYRVRILAVHPPADPHPALAPSEPAASPNSNPPATSIDPP